jgi:hypothetical protein
MLGAIRSSPRLGYVQHFLKHLNPAASVSWSLSSAQQQHSALLHSSVTRDPAYSKHNEDDVDYFKSVLGNRGVVQGASALEPMNRSAHYSHNMYRLCGQKYTGTQTLDQLTPGVEALK